MQTLASILAGTGGNPYQSADAGGISPLLTQWMLANQLGSQQLGQGGQQPQTIPGQSSSSGQQAVPGQPLLPTIGSMGAATLPALIPGSY